MNNFRNFFLPYCAKPLGNNWYVFLNRNYKPLGHNSSVWLPDEEYLELLEDHAIRVMRPKLLQSSHYSEPREGSMIYFHQGSMRNEKDWTAYFKKLYQLAELDINLP